MVQSGTHVAPIHFSVVVLYSLKDQHASMHSDVVCVAIEMISEDTQSTQQLYTYVTETIAETSFPLPPLGQSSSSDGRVLFATGDGVRLD